MEYFSGNNSLNSISSNSASAPPTQNDLSQPRTSATSEPADSLLPSYEGSSKSPAATAGFTGYGGGAYRRLSVDDNNNDGGGGGGGGGSDTTIAAGGGGGRRQFHSSECRRPESGVAASTGHTENVSPDSVLPPHISHSNPSASADTWENQNSNNISAKALPLDNDTVGGSTDSSFPLPCMGEQSAATAISDSHDARTAGYGSSSGLMSRMSVACPQQGFTGQQHMSMMSSGQGGGSYDMAGYHHTGTYGAAAHLNRHHHHLLGSPSANLIPLAAPTNYMRMRSGFPTATSAMNNASTYSLLPAPAPPSFYYDYSSLSRQQQAAAAAAAAASFQRSSDHYGNVGGGGGYCPSSLTMNGGSSGNMGLVQQAQSHVVASRDAGASGRVDIASQSPFTGQLSGSTGGCQTGSVSVPGGPIKRPRGRPRKHPLPVPQQLQQMYTPNGVPMSQVSVGGGESMVQQTAARPIDVSGPTAVSGFPTVEGKQNSLLSQTSLARRRNSRASRYLRSLSGLYSSYTLGQVQQLDSSLPQMETAEEYIALGGPFVRLALAVVVQQKAGVDDDDDIEQKIENNSAGQQLLETLCNKIIRACPRAAEIMSISLNRSFVWASLDPRVPVRDLTLSRHHMAALLNDSRVFVYRHKTHPLVCSRVDDWEHVEALDSCGVVAVRIASALLPDDWRQTFHNTRRPHIIARVRRELAEAGIELAITSNPDIVTPDELKFYVAHHPDGILCCPTDMLDPDWLPDPFVLAALDHTGIVRVARCCGYYNYPRLVEVKENQLPSSEPVATTDSLAPVTNVVTNAISVPMIGEDGALPPEEGKEETKTEPIIEDDSPSAHPQIHKQIEYKYVSLDQLDKHPTLQVPTKEVDEKGKAIKAKAQIQDLALGELTFASFLSPDNPSALESSMVLYAVGNNEHSAFVKGRNLYIRFKNFPTGPAKLQCSPLGHAGAVLLANGSVWSWSTTPKVLGSGTDKIGAAINQVEGSLANRTVVDLVAVGADFMALSSDGVVHEWNCYEPYIAYGGSGVGPAGEDMVIPQSSYRPSIPVAIEYTPDFQKKLMATILTSKTRPVFEAGRFSWFKNSQLPTGPTTAATTTDCDEPVGASSVTSSVIDTAIGTSNVATSTLPGDITQQQSRRETHHSKSTLTEDANLDFDFSSEEILEWHRQQEIKTRYLSVIDPTSKEADPIERIYLTEGVTMFLRASSGKIEAVPNELSAYHSSGDKWSNVRDCFTVEHASTLMNQHMGKPIATNPVVIARMRLPRDLTDEQLRAQLEQMASASPPTYRLLVSPTAMVIAILRRLDLTEEAKKMLLVRVPVPIAAFNPKLYLEAFTGLTPTLLTQTQQARANRPSRRLVLEEATTDGSEGGRERKERVGGRKSRGRVGRPRGSRAGVRASLSCRMTSAGSRSTDIMEDAAVPVTEQNVEAETTTEAEVSQPPAAAAVAEAVSITVSGGGVSSSTRKRHRRQSSVLDEQQFFTGFADSDDSDKAWEQAMQLMEVEGDSDDDEKKKKKSKNKKRGTRGLIEAADDGHVGMVDQQLALPQHIVESSQNSRRQSAVYYHQAYQQAYNSMVLQVGTPAPLDTFPPQSSAMEYSVTSEHTASDHNAHHHQQRTQRPDDDDDDDRNYLRRGVSKSAIAKSDPQQIIGGGEGVVSFNKQQPHTMALKTDDDMVVDTSTSTPVPHESAPRYAPASYGATHSHL